MGKDRPCLCTSWLQYRKLQLMFEVSPTSLQGQGDTRLTLMPSVIPNTNYVIMVSDWNCLKRICVFLFCNHRMHRLSDHPVCVCVWVCIHARACVHARTGIQINRTNRQDIDINKS
jgi:hypothetical protein